MKKHLRLLAMAALLVLPLAACDEGEETAVAPPATGTITGTVTADGTGLAGVTVTLSGGGTQTTNSSGQYTFTNVTAGSYTVTISGFPSDVAFASTAAAAVITSAGQTVTVNFSGSRIRTSTILGTVLTSNGAPLNGVTVTITGVETKTATTANGAYSFGGLRAGTYTVAISGIPTGNTCAVTSQANQTVAAGEAKVVNFQCQTSAPPPPGTGTISGVIFTDANSNGVQDGGEPVLALSGVKVFLEGPTVGVRDSTRTTDGRYTFASRTVGNYNVSINAADATLANAGVSAVAPTSRAVTVTAGQTTTANFGTLATTQRVNVFAMMGRDSTNSGLSTSIPLSANVNKPAPGVVIALYADEASAIAGGTAGRLGLDTTDTRGETQFSFLRTNDIGPNCAANCTNPDQIVYAQYVSNNGGLVLNGETRIEIRYDVLRQPTLAPDSFDLLNPAAVIKLDVLGQGTNQPLSGWNVSLFTDTTAAAAATVATDANGRSIFNVAPGIGGLPATYYLKAAGAQAAALGHAFSVTPVAEQGTVTGTYLKFVYNGTARTGDTLDVGDDRVRFNDADVMVRVHHEADDSVPGDGPRLSSGDNFEGVTNIRVMMRWRQSGAATDSVRAALTPGLDGVVVFPNVPTRQAPYVIGAFTTTASQVVLEEDTLFTVGQNNLGDLSGGTFSTLVCPLGPGTLSGCSTFAEKFTTGTINVTVRDASGTVNADSVKIRVRSDPRTIQPRPVDTLLTVSRGGVGGVASVTGIRDGFYIVSVLHDSISSTGDTVWAFVGSANQTATVDVQGTAAAGDVDNVAFTARRGDTQIQGYVANDRDADQNTVDPGEGLAGVTLSLYRDGSGTITLDTLVKTTTTDANGAYSFTGLREGTYAVKAASPTGAVVLRRFTATGAVVDTAIVHTTAIAAANCQNADNLRRVGTNDISCYSAANPLPIWNPTTSTASNVNPASFTFLYSTGTATGFVKTAGGTAVPSMTVTLRRCATSAAAPTPPAAGTCGTYFAGFTPQNSTTNASGQFTFSALQEGVYEVTTSPASAGYASTTPASMLYWLSGANDVETGNFVANP